MSTDRTFATDDDSWAASEAGFRAWQTGRGPAARAGYRVVRHLATGGLGEVLVGHDEALERRVAIKQIRPELADRDEARARFLIEAKVTGRLEHPGVVPIYALGHDDAGRPYYAMRLIEGGTFLEAIAAFHAPPGPDFQSLAFRDLLARFLDVCNVVAYAHDRGVLHRDLKPSNVMLGKFGETLVVDWGLAKLLDRDEPGSPADGAAGAQTTGTLQESGSGWMRSGSSLDPSPTQPGTPVGSRGYMSPEQALGDATAVGPASDVYSLGATLYHLLAGARPLAGVDDPAEVVRCTIAGVLDPPRSRVAAIPPALEAICGRAMHRSPAARYGSPLDLAADLRHWLADEPIAGVAEPMAVRVSRWERRHRRLIRGASLALLATATIATVATVIVWRANGRERQALAAETTQRQLAEQHETLANASQQAAQAQSATLLLERGLEWADREEYGRALLWLTRALAEVPSHRADLERAIRTALATCRARITAPVAILDHRDHAISRFAFAPDGAVIATGDMVGHVRLWDARTGRPLGLPAEGLIHGGGVTVLEFARQAPALLVATGAGGLLVRDPATGQPRGPLIELHREVRAAALSADGARVLAGAEDGTCGLWDVATGNPIAGVPSHAARVVSVGFAAGDTRLFTADAGGTIRIVEPASGTPVGPEIHHPGGLNGAVLRDDGAVLLSFGTDRKARLWDVATGRLLHELDHRGALERAEFAPDGDTLLTAGHSTVVRLWDVETGTEVLSRLGSIEHRSFVPTAQFGAGGTTLVTGSFDRTARLWDAGSQRGQGNTLPHTEQVIEVRLAPDGRSVATQTRAGRVRLWRMGGDRGLGVTASPRSDDTVQALKVTPDGRHALTAGGARVLVRDLATGAPVGAPLPFAGEVRALALSADGRRVVAGGRSPGGRPPTGLGTDPPGLAQVWDLDTGAPLGAPLASDLDVLGVAIRGDGRVVATASRDETLRLFAADTGAPLGPPIRHPQAVQSVLFSGDGLTVYTGCADGRVRAWDVATGARRGPDLVHDDAVRVLALHPDGRRLATGSLAGTAQLWDPTTGTPLGPALRHEGWVTGLAFSPDGTTLATVGMGRTLRFWDVSTGARLGPELRHRNAIWCADFRPDGRAVLTGGEDHIVRTWPVPVAAGEPADRLAREARVLAGLGLNRDETYHTLTDAEWQAERTAFEALPPSGPPAQRPLADGPRVR